MLAFFLILGMHALFAAVLLLPVDMVIEAEMGAKSRLNVQIVWLFGAVKARIKRPQHKQTLTRATAQEKQISLARRLERMRLMVRLLRVKGLMRQVAHLLRGIIRSVRVRDMGIDLSIGLGDPADTGMLFAMVGPLAPLLETGLRCPVLLRPVLSDEPTLQGYCRGTVRLVPIRLVRPFLHFIFSAPAFRAIKTVVRERWKK